MLDNSGTTIEALDDAALHLHEELQEHGDDDAIVPLVEKLEKALRKQLDVKFVLVKEMDAASELRRNVMQFQEAMGTGEFDLVAEFEKTSLPQIQAFLSEDEGKRYKQFEEFKDYQRKVWDIKNPGRPFYDSDEEVDPDLVVTEEQASLICPITLKLMDKVWTCTRCKHNFSSAIFDVLQKQGGEIECPVAGCEHYVTRASLRKNARFQRLVDAERRAIQLTQQAENEEYELV